MRLLILALASALAVFTFTTWASAADGPIFSSGEAIGVSERPVAEAPPAVFASPTSPGLSSLMEATQCVPYTCEAWGPGRDMVKMCGPVSDGCGGTLHCGYCTAPDRCIQNICVGNGPPPPIDPL
ncbi:MAG TPA: hypothetical protein VK013_04095 [Myxococcaceae bacterium]|nr:hypothetical protein [Myxococcaceae bacterium]